MNNQDNKAISEDNEKLSAGSVDAARLPEDIKNMFAEITVNNPIGTKFLIELEIVAKEGMNNTMDCMFAKSKIEEFQDLTGCMIAKIFTKEAKVIEDGASLIAIAESLMKKAQELNRVGIN